MGNLMGNSGFLPTAGQAGFPPVPTLPEGEVGTGNGAPGIPDGERFPDGEMGNGKRENMEAENGGFGSLLSNREYFSQMLEFAAKLIRLGKFDAAAWRIADASGWLVGRIESDQFVDVCGVHWHTGMGARLVAYDATKADLPIDVGGHHAQDI